MFKVWLTGLYKIDDVTDDQLQQFKAMFEYQGFNREETLKQLHLKVGDKMIVMQLVLLDALRGPQAGSKIKMTNGKTALEMGIPASGGKGTKNLTLSRITSATADIAAWMLKKIGVNKRIDMDLPAWLQFPAAGGIKMSPELREKHKEFSKRFSDVIGGGFNEGIYSAMANNSYCDEGLKLFA